MAELHNVRYIQQINCTVEWRTGMDCPGKENDNNINPIGSMDGIFTCIFYQNQPNLGT